MNINTIKEKLQKNISAILAVLLLVVGTSSFYFYQKFSELRQNPQKIAQEEVANAVASVGKLIVLPDEQPTIATVNDPAKLKDQLFFAKSAKGDKVLIYTNARKAILYSPSQNKIVEVAPLNIGNPQR